MTASAHLELLPSADVAPRGELTEGLRRAAAPERDLLPPLPQGPAAWAEAVASARGTTSPAPAAYVTALVERQAALGAGSAAIENARALGDPTTLAVVTGQQPGLLGGPLMTFHKVAGAIHLARRLDGEAAGRVVPVFWLASEDHDLVEANQALFLDRGSQARRVSLDRHPDGRSLMHVPVDDEEVRTLLDAVRAFVPETGRGDDLVRRLERAAGEDFATWSLRCLLRLLGDSGLVVVEPPHLLPFAGEELAHLLEETGTIRDALAASARRLQASGRPAPLDVGDDYAPLFLREQAEGPRRRVTLGSDGRVRVRRRQATLPLAEVAAKLRGHPELGSGDAAGRVFLQNALLPVLAYVGGPTELAYHAQVRAAHAAVGRPYPFAVPRPEATWVDGKARRTAASFGLTVPQVLAAGPREAPPRSDEDEGVLEAYIDDWEGALAEPPRATGLEMEGGGQGPDAVRRAAQRLADTLRRQRPRILDAFARDRGTNAGRWMRLQALLFPRGRPQERGLSAASVVARWGVQAFREGLGHLDPLVHAHHLLVVD